MLIGTHRVLSRDVVPSNLGLVVVDEEQRFGVAQKELLRQLRLEVDVLSLTRRRFPRTLHMSLAGLRDISMIETPPEGRRPIRTYVGEYDEELVKHALERETERGGQSFYLHNRVETIEEAAAKLAELCPDLRLLVAHGQMAERELEERMMEFLRGDADVLVSTTIIESGLDIPQANTLVVERADMLGLAQLYQIRGRVGRSDVPAHAYLLYPDATELTPEARARLSTLADHTELGSGFAIAMRDLEIRGAGELLGREQSGHVAAVGFELYVDLLNEAVEELAGGKRLVPRPVRIDARVDAYVPPDYVVVGGAEDRPSPAAGAGRDRGRAPRAACLCRGSLRRPAGARREPLRATGGTTQDRGDGRGLRGVSHRPADRRAVAARRRGRPRHPLEASRPPSIRASGESSPCAATGSAEGCPHSLLSSTCARQLEGAFFHERPENTSSRVDRSGPRGAVARCHGLWWRRRR